MAIDMLIRKKWDKFSLDINFKSQSKRIGILGASGCGKSMTLKCIAGIETPDKGRIVLNDRVLFDSEKKINIPIQKRNVGYMFQSYALFPNMNVYENISVGLKARKVKDVDIVVKKVMQQFRISELASRYPKQLSGGQRQRVALARLMAYEPDVLLLDEPFSALDEDLKEDLLRELKMELQISKPVIFVSHNKEEVNDLCDLKYKIKEGELV